jgi:hypothetical protein
MNKKEKVPFEIYADLLSTNRRMYEKINWQETFIDYIKENNREMYYKARRYADNLEAEHYDCKPTEEEKKKWGMTYKK